MFALYVYAKDGITRSNPRSFGLFRLFKGAEGDTSVRSVCRVWLCVTMQYLCHSEQKGCRERTFEREDEGVYSDVNDRSPNRKERALYAPLSSLWSERRYHSLKSVLV